MKFLCDRCKTRYSIGDDRVRGKILKIRCKNCANVITVREGMTPDGEGPPADEARARKPAAAAAETREAPEAPGTRDAREAPGTRDAPGAREAPDTHDAAASRDDARPAPAAAKPGAARDPLAGLSSKRSTEIDTVRALGRGNVRAGATPPRGEVHAPQAAVAAAAPAPAALEEEWYVSIDGEQAGPFSLADAQRWVTQQPLDAELHCWSEGFDDWLPVDKVSHFRGLRKRPLSSSTPPPVPRATAGAPRPAAAEDDPKPLFAATMASLEREAAAVPAGVGGPQGAAPAARAASLRETPIAARGESGRPTNGAQAPATPLGARTEAGSEAPAGRPEPAAATRPAGNAARTPAGKRGAKDGALEAPASTASDRPRFGDPFELGEGAAGEPEATDGKTVLEAMPFDDAPVEPRRASASALGGTPRAAADAVPPQSDFGSDDDLDIGEVSRVVNLADITRGGRQDRPAPGRAPTAPGVVTRTSGLPPSQRPGTQSSASSASLPPEPEPGMTSAPIARAQRRGLIALLVVAGVLVLGVVGAVLLFVTRDDDTPTTSLDTVQDIDTSRPDNPVAHHPVGSAGSAGSASIAAPPPAPVPPRPRPRPTPGAGQVAEAPAGGNALGGDEIEDVARKYQEMTQRCYMRSQRGTGSILVGDVKKIAVTLTIDREGNVSDVQLSDHAADTLGKCLSGTIRTWKFRPSAGGTFRFSLNFLDG